MSSSVNERVRKRREKLRRAGLRPVQIWVPDTRQPGFAAECRRQSQLVTNDPHEAAMLEWLAAASDDTDWV